MTSFASATADPAFAGKVVLVTGAAGNFGSTGVRHFLQLGCSVVLADANEQGLNSVLDELRAAQGSDPNKLFGVLCDNTKEDQVQSMVDDAVAKFGRIDMLWNNAGYQGDFTPVLGECVCVRVCIYMFVCVCVWSLFSMSSSPLAGGCLVCFSLRSKMHAIATASTNLQLELVES
jgi:hypothetical protein